MPSPDPEDRAVLTRAARPPDAQWSYGPDPGQVADVYLPEGPVRDAVLLVHGGFWRPEYDRAHLRPLAEALSDAGHLVVSVEYARRPGEPDRTTADLRLALAGLPGLLAQHATVDAPVVLVGHSAGGHLALWLASVPGAVGQGVLALAPVADLGQAEGLGLDGGAVGDFLGGRAAGRPDLDPARSPTPAMPVTVVHGVEDTLVPVGLSRSFAAAHGDAVRLVEVGSAAHFAVIDPQSAAWPQVLAELDRLLARPPAPNAASPGPSGIE